MISLPKASITSTILKTTALTLVLYSTNALADDSAADDSSSLWFTEFQGGVGYAWIEATELVYEGGNRISRLNWRSHAPIIGGELKTTFDDKWTAAVNGSLAFSGNSFMRNTDWLTPYVTSYDADSWTDRSYHPDTDLDRYLDLSIALGRNFEVSPNALINLHGGFRYVSTEWNAYGGNYIYSTAAFRDDTGSFTAGQPNIRYEQELPTLFIGFEGSLQRQDWTFTGVVQGGATVGGNATDHHWQRNLRFEDSFDPIPFLSAGATIERALSERTALFVSGNISHHFRTKGDTDIFQISDGSFVQSNQNSAGTALTSGDIRVGLKMSF